MNIYSAATISTGLSLILINQFSFKAVAKETPDDPVDNCQQINGQVIAPTETINFNSLGDRAQLVASTKALEDLNQSSFWWAALQFDPFGGNLIQDWLTYPQKQQINLVVNWRLWSLLDYFGRYRFVNQFGTVARRHGYSLSIFNQKDRCLASYRYNSTSIPPKWELNLEKLGRASLPIESEPASEYIVPEP